MFNYISYMNILIASDKFKGSLRSEEVCRAIENGLLKSGKDVMIKIQQMADGGDGTMKIIKEILQLKTIQVNTEDALGRPIIAEYYTDDTHAFIELAEASGIARLSTDELNPLITQTTGTGIIIKDALSKGYHNIVLGLGGSCTHDIGLGIAHVLGFSFIDQEGQRLIPNGGNLMQINQFKKIKFPLVQMKLLCDVKNPLYGLQGAAHTYAAQKGAGPADIELLDSGSKHIADLIERHCDMDVSTKEGGGAAGGIAAGMVGLFQAELQSGFDFLSKLTRLENKIKEADIVITGEGTLDKSSLDGKVVGQMIALCQKYNKPIIVVAGDSSLHEDEIKASRIKSVHTVLQRADDLTDSIKNAKDYIIKISSELL